MSAEGDSANRVDPPLKLVCSLAAFQSSTIRAALLKTGVVDVLANNIQDDSALHALVAVAGRKTARSYVERHAMLIANALLATRPNDITRGALLMHLLNVALSSGRALTIDAGMANATHEQLVVHAAMNGAAFSPSVASYLISRFARATTINAAFQSSNLGVIFDAKAISCYEAVAKRGGVKLLAQRIEGNIVSAFVQNPTRHINLIAMLVPYMSSNAYHPDLVTTAIGAENGGQDASRFYAVVLLSHMLQRDVSRVHECLTTHPFFKELLDKMLEAIDAGSPDSCHSAAPVFVLQLAVRDCLPATEMLRFGAVLHRTPALFNFAVSDDIGALRRIVSLAEAFKLEPSAYSLYRDALEEKLGEIRRSERLAAAGLDDMTLPDAFHCPVTMEVMKDPVVASDGHSYERSTLLTLLGSRARSPLTRAPLDPRIIVPNFNLRKRIRDYADDACAIARKVSRSDASQSDSN